MAACLNPCFVFAPGLYLHLHIIVDVSQTLYTFMQIFQVWSDLCLHKFRCKMTHVSGCKRALKWRLYVSGSKEERKLITSCGILSVALLSHWIARAKQGSQKYRERSKVINCGQWQFYWETCVFVAFFCLPFKQGDQGARNGALSPIPGGWHVQVTERCLPFQAGDMCK
jgi:hypothetical protein